jgi:hypothetical protein
MGDTVRVTLKHVGNDTFILETDGGKGIPVDLAGATITADTLNLDTADLEAKIGALNAAKVTDPAAPSASLAQLLRGILDRDAAVAALLGGTTAQTVGFMTRGNPKPLSSDAPYVIAASAGAFAPKDLMGNSETANLVVPITFTLARPKGRIYGCRGVMAPASGNVAWASLAFDFLLMRADPNVPYADAGYPASNSEVTFADIASATAVSVSRVGRFSFASSSWEKATGESLSGAVTGMTAVQSATLASGLQYFPFDLSDLTPPYKMRAIPIAREAWNNGNVAHTLYPVLIVDYD